MPDKITRIVHATYNGQQRLRIIDRLERGGTQNEPVSSAIGVIVAADDVRATVDIESSGVTRRGKIENSGLNPL